MTDTIALFDLDGVILNTENNYTWFWNKIGKEYLGVEGFGLKVKGQTLVRIFNDAFPSEDDRSAIKKELFEFERDMEYEYIPGAEAFIDGIRALGIRSAVVTSSDRAKMQNVFRNLPDFKDKFERILMSEDFKESKPSPDGFLTGMRVLGGTPETSVVFEDSINGLKAGKASGAFLVGLATSNPPEIVGRYADLVIPDFTSLEPSGILSRFQ